jgi:DnaJ-class molecular chaperone
LLPRPPQYANEGMPVHNFPSQHGSLHVKFIVDLPASLTKEQKEALDKALNKP